MTFIKKKQNKSDDNVRGHDPGLGRTVHRQTQRVGCVNTCSTPQSRVGSQPHCRRINVGLFLCRN